MANTKKVRDDIIPLKAGIVRVIPLDANGNPLYAQAITTNRDFLTSTQITVSRTTETLANGNGSDKEMPTDETYNLALITNSYNPKFHALLSNKDVAREVKPILYDTTVTVEELQPGTSWGFKFAEDKYAPVASEDEAYHFEIRDTYGNLFEDISGKSDGALGEGNYKYDSDTKTLSFAEQYKNISFDCIYYIAGTDGEGYQSRAILQTKTFMIETMGEVQSASTGERLRYYSRMERAVVSGDLPNIMTQKSLTNSMTYNFKSAPVPTGVRVFYDSFTPISEA